MPQNVDINSSVVTTFAGNGGAGTADGVGAAARFSQPMGVSLDGTGGLYVADTSNCVIRRVDIPTRTVTTVAGVTGSCGSIVGATPLQSTFNGLIGVEVDGAGNVYVAAIGNHAIRMMSGVWIAGTGASGSANAAVGTSATFSYPHTMRADVAVGMLYVADCGNYQVRTIATAPPHAVGTLATLLKCVRDVALNPAARILYAAVDHSVYIVTYAGVPTLLAGSATTSGIADGTGGAARFNTIGGVALDASARVLYVTDYSNHRIRCITTAGGVVTTTAGSGTGALVDGVGSAAAFFQPFGVALDASSGKLYIADSVNNAIRQLQLPPPIPAGLVVAPLPPSPFALTHQLTSWRALGTSNSNLGAASAQPALDARNVTISAPLAPTNTAGLNPAICAMLLGNVTLVPRDAALAAAGNTNTTFSTSAQRGLRSLSLATLAVPPAALALPVLTTLTLTAPTQQLQLTNDSFVGLTTLTTLAISNINNISSPYFAWLPAVSTLLSLDLSGNAITTINEHDFDATRSLRWLSLADTALTYVNDAAFSAAKQPALAVLNLSRTPLVTGAGCRPGFSNTIQLTPAGGMPYVACRACPSGASCVGGASSPVQCGTNTFAAGGAAACTLCPPSTYATGAAKECVTCPPGFAAPSCNATASWRDTITLVTDDAGNWVNASIYLVPAGRQPATANVSCGPLVVLSTTTVSCVLSFLLSAAATAPVLTNVWVAHTGTGGILQHLNAPVILLPLPLALVPGGGIGLAPHTSGTGRIALRLPAPRLAAADWTAVGLPPPPQATIDGLAVWLDGAPCTVPAWESATTLSCATPATDATNVAAVVQLAGGAFNVSGVLPSLLLSTPALCASTELQLLPPAQSTSNPVINITLAGVGLCAGGGVPQLAAAAVVGVPCGSVVCTPGRPDAALCVGWNTSHPAVDMLRATGPQVAVNVSVTWTNSASRPVTCDACVTLATRPVLTSITPTSIATPGVPVVVAGTGFMDAAHALPTVVIGNEVCGNATVLSPTVLQCISPNLLPSAPGYPVVSVVVVNAAGAASTELVNLTYPATFAVSWAPSSTTLTALPGGLLSPAPTLRVLSHEAATCTLTINTTSCATSDASLASRPSGMTVSSPATSLSVGASGSSDAVPTDLLLDALTVSGASGCTGTLMASCIDAVGQSGSTAMLPDNPAVALVSWRADWSTTSVPQPFTVVPGELPTITATFTILSGSGDATLDAGSMKLSCLALLLLASATPPPLTKSLDLVSPRDMLSTSTAAVVALNDTAAGVAFAGLSASGVQLGQALAVYAECTWVPTGERVRLPPLALSTLALAMDWVSPPATLLGYTPLLLHAAVTMLTRATAAAGTGSAAMVASAECEVLLVNATARSARLGAADPWTVEIDAAAPAGTTVTTSTNVTIEAAPATTAFIRASCTIWGQALVSPPLPLITASLTLRLASVPPPSFIASDASSAWLVDPQLDVVVVAGTVDDDGSSTMNVTDVTCSLSTATTGVELKVAGSSASSALLSIPAHPATGAVAVPRFYVQTATTTATLDLVIDCRRTSGDAPPPLQLTILATLLTAQLCNQPARDSFVGTALPIFAVGIVATPPGAPATTPCATTASPPPLSLPAIVCTIALDASTTTTNDTANIFLQHTLATVSATTHCAVFDAFTVVAPQGETYGLALTCAVGGLAIPPTLSFTVTLAGCSIGQESQGVACVTCGGTSFSPGGVGASCTGCPPVGTVCNGGILTLLPHYYRPPVQAGAPLGPTTELHPCYNADACTLEVGGNVSGGAAYGCAYGYTGPLCGVCDADVNYARFGEACAVCWDTGASWLFLVAVVGIVLAVLTRVALRKDSGRSDASIVLRITLGYLQAVGSLRVFRAGSTKAYDNVMGWTEVVSASPLSVGALECILRLPYLFQYIATILLPVAASAAVVVIFHAATTGRSLNCKPRCSMDTVAFRTAVKSWWATKRHLSTLLFVLFLAYMPIVSASLRALDCIDPVAGVRYLRSDLRVECNVGEHAVARALAFTVLVALGAGFPAGLAWLLGTARNEQLVDPAFHATWGFLFDGYRAPTRTPVASPLPLLGNGPSRGSDGPHKLLGVVRRVPVPVAMLAGSSMGADPSKSTPTAGVPPPPPAASAGGAARREQRRSTLVPERLTQSWVASGDSRVWWEAVVLARKAGVVLLAVTLTNPYLQCVGASLWFLAATALQVRYTPYTKPLFNRLETASLVTTLLTAVISTALLQYNVGVTSAELHPPDAMTGIEWAVTVLLAVMNVGTFAVLAGLWLRAQCVRARGIMRRASVVTALAGRVAGLRASLAARRRSSAATGIAARARHVAAGTMAGATDVTPTTTVNPLRAHTGAAVAAVTHDDVAATDAAIGLAADAAAAAPSTTPSPSVAASHRRSILPTATVAFTATPVARSRRR